jgi:hypothetical protein
MAEMDRVASALLVVFAWVDPLLGKVFSSDLRLLQLRLFAAQVRRQTPF